MKILFFLAFLLFTFTLGNSFFKVNIDQIGFEKLNKLKSLFKGTEYTIELGPELIVFAQPESVDKISELNLEYSLITSNIQQPKLKILRDLHHSEVAKLNNVFVIMTGHGGFTVLHSENEKLNLYQENLIPFTPNMVLIKQTENENITFSKTKSPTIEKMIAFINENSNQWIEEVKKLASFNRFSYGQQIAKSKDYILQELAKLGKYNVTLEEYSLRGTKMWNIKAEIKGTDEHYLMCAHLDSTSNGSGNERVSPGAVDDGSGSAALIEMAKVFAKFPPKKTFQLIWFTGEEQGLIGSTASATNVVNRGDKNKVKVMIQMDMIGYKRDSADHVVLLETSRTHQDLVKVFLDNAQKYTALKTQVSYSPFGSDHVPYLNRGMPALLTIDNDWNRYPHYHRTTDLPQYVVPKQGVEIMKMNVATMAKLMGTYE